MSVAKSIAGLVAVLFLSSSGYTQQKSIKVDTRMGTTSSVAPIHFENILENQTSRYDIDLAMELDIGYTPVAFAEIGATMGRYTAVAASDNGNFSAVTLGLFGKLLVPDTKPAPHATAGLGIAGLDFRTPAQLGAESGHRVSWTAPWAFVGAGMEWRLSGFYFDLAARYHLSFIKGREFNTGGFAGPGGPQRNQFKVMNHVRFVTVAAGFIFDFPLNP